jgi:lycopene cyclase domain-containing protein
MNQLYLLLDLSVIFFPFVLSFDKKVNYVSDWKFVLYSLIIIAVPFLVHDYFFTEMGVWGFNPDYLTGFYLLNLPIEEVLFFIVVPFACLFIYRCCQEYFGHLKLTVFNTIYYSLALVYSLAVLCYGFGAWYSTLVSITTIILLLYLFVFKSSVSRFIPLATFLSLIPFFLMNSVLTGYFTDSPVVWYDNTENLSLRWGTIPYEDILYSFILVAMNILVFDFFKNRKSMKEKLLP